jgi:hypothetical protein
MFRFVVMSSAPSAKVSPTLRAQVSSINAERPRSVIGSSAFAQESPPIAVTQLAAYGGPNRATGRLAPPALPPSGTQ